jgi:hypothetical protein
MRRHQGGAYRLPPSARCRDSGMKMSDGGIDSGALHLRPARLHGWQDRVQRSGSAIGLPPCTGEHWSVDDFCQRRRRNDQRARFHRLWFVQSGNNLKIDLMGTNTSVTVARRRRGPLRSPFRENASGRVKILWTMFGEYPSQTLGCVAYAVDDLSGKKRVSTLRSPISRPRQTGLRFFANPGPMHVMREKSS